MAFTPAAEAAVYQRKKNLGNRVLGTTTLRKNKHTISFRLLKARAWFFSPSPQTAFLSLKMVDQDGVSACCSVHTSSRPRAGYRSWSQIGYRAQASVMGMAPRKPCQIQQLPLIILSHLWVLEKPHVLHDEGSCPSSLLLRQTEQALHRVVIMKVCRLKGGCASAFCFPLLSVVKN